MFPCSFVPTRFHAFRAWLLPFLLPFAATSADGSPAPAGSTGIEREALVRRHHPIVRTADPTSALTVGNGGFAFTVDVTGLQTFGDTYIDGGFPLETQARWAWVTDENPQNHTLDDAAQAYRLPDGRTLEYPTRMDTPAGRWLRQNPRAQPLAVVSLEWTKSDGSPFVPADVHEARQTLELWTGTITSAYTLGGEPVRVRTTCAPDADVLAIEVESPLVAQGDLRLRVAFPRGHRLDVKNTPDLDWSRPESHQSALVGRRIRRDVGGLRYHVTATGADFAPADRPHVYFINGDSSGRLAVTLAFGPADRTEPAPRSSAEVRAAAARHWPEFWRQSAALDLTGSTDPRAAELERRVVLSQYLTAVQLAGEVPPQESGLTCNTWYGKHHTEMIWWHAAHFALWGQPSLLEKNLAWYQARLPAARELARSRGLRGARWAKMVGPDGRDSPGGNPLIVWNQPHLIHLGELLYRLDPSPEVLRRYRDLVLETADCLASMAWLDPARNTYVLGPPLWIAQEIHDPATSQNPSFELAYWGWALEVAQQWRERLGEPRDPGWQDVIERLSPLPLRDGKYVALESHPDTWDTVASRHDHPEMLMALGFLPDNPAVDATVMHRTLDAVLAAWDWETKVWGWDYPMIAMTAVRLGRPHDAIDVLLRDGPNNHYLPNGHCPQRSDVAATLAPGVARGRPEIAVYLPANGALLATVALMVAGWDGAAREHPGFPADGTWTVRAEGWQPLP